MIKKYSLVLVAFLCFILSGLGQVTIHTNPCIASTAGWTYTNGTTTQPIQQGGYWLLENADVIISEAFDVSSYTSGLELSFQVATYGSGSPDKPCLVEYSLDNGTTWSTNTFTSATPTSATYIASGIFSIPSSTSTQFKLRFKKATTGGRQGVRIDNILFQGYLPSCTDSPNLVNIQWPNASPQIINDGDNFEVFAQANEPGLTEAGGAAPGLVAWIGYNTVDNNPSSTGWTWIPTTFNLQVGDNDEFIAEIGSGLSPGTFYYASRFELNGCGYVYGGTGGIWDNDSVELIVNPVQVNFCNVEFPKNGASTTGNPFTVYAQVYEPGVTDAAGQGAGIAVEIGYNTIDIDHQPWDPSGWTWVAATYNPTCLDCNGIQNDEYMADIGSTLPAGTYYYASRFQLNGSSYSYGGIQADNVGNFWDATNNNGVLTIADPPLADVVITEIMYNTTSTDDEWIEICNVSGSQQNLSNYTVRVNGTIRFTFPVGIFIADGNCITVSLGSDGDGIYNNACPFTPDYGIGASSGPTNILPNTVGPNTIRLFASNGTSIADEVSYGTGNGANGNGSSLHVNDATLDNSSAGNGNWTTVPTGGSPGVNSLVSPCSPIEPEINVEGDVGTFPDIANNDTTPSGTDNTLFAAQLIGSSQEKGFRIQNLGIVDLTISSISIVGTNPGDFTISVAPATTIPSGGLTTFEISFSPLAAGTRTADVRIESNDLDEPVFMFRIQGTGNCVANTITIFPTSGPENTVVTVTGTNLNGASASFNGLPATVTPISATQMEVTVPANAISGNLEIIDGLGCPGSTAFTIIDKKIADCDGGATLGELFISQVTDSPKGSLTYVELYNPTASNINFTTTNYSISLYNNGNTGATGTIVINTGTIAQNGTFVVVMGVTTTICTESGGDGSLGQLVTPNSSLSINFNQSDNSSIGHDFIGLYNSASTLIDSFGVFGNETWANGLGLGTAGANFERKTDVTLPSTAFSTADWNITNWNACSDVNYSNIGIYDFSLGSPPTVTALVAPASSCDLTAQLTIQGGEGVSGGNALAYQWYYNVPGTASWVEILSSDGSYSGQQSDTLDILNTLNFDNYQYYCQVRENTATCYTASNAIRLHVDKTTWDGATWSPTTPDINTIAVIDGDYYTNTNGSFSACQLMVTADHFLNVTDGTFVEVQNYVIIDGDILVETHGAFVQRADLNDGFVLNTGATSKVNKSTAIVYNWYDYTYWSSPVSGTTVGEALDIAPANRRFWYDAINYLDVFMETGNNNASDAGHDDIDDNNDDWVLAPAGFTMDPGQGFAATVMNFGMFPGTRQIVFSGPYNTGTINTPVFWNGDNGDNDWNLIGNPYPSAISFNDLYDNNTSLIAGAAYLWSQASPPSNVNNGNQVINFNNNDYAVISRFSGNTAGGDMIIPTDYIPSGQAFFVKALSNGNITFNNDMRMADLTSNNQFFRTIAGSEPNRLWVNLTSDNGVFNQILMAYVDGATSGDDGMGYDAHRNMSTGAASVLYTMVDGVSDRKFAIQGKNPNSLSLDEIIPLGFSTSITQPTNYKLSIDHVQGEFLTENTVYLKDHLLNITVDLSNSDYTFSSEPGEFNNRFEIVFINATLSVIDNEIPTSGLTIIELADGQVKFSVGHSLDIKSVEIIDMLGRSLYRLNGNSPTEIYDLSNLSQAAYIAKVTLSNGQTITKRAVKRQ